MSTFTGKVVLITEKVMYQRKFTDLSFRDLQKKTEIVLDHLTQAGASSGIGEGTAVHFAKLKAKLSLMGRNSENLDNVSKQCLDAGAKSEEILTVAGDINNPEDRKSIVEKTVQKFGQLDILVNNAGVIHYKSVGQITEEEYDDLMNTNLRSQVFLTQLALPHIIKSKGNIVNTSSICGSKSMPMIGGYCMSKAGADMFTRCLALEMAPHGVRVNAISPGTIVSNIARRPTGPFQDDADYAKFLETQTKGHPLGRVGVPQDCAEAIAFLASDASSFTTGQILYIDGGRNCVSVGVPTGK